MRSRRLDILAGCLALVAASAAAFAEPAEPVEPVPPDAIPGLVAWYDARTLYDRLRNRAPVEFWPDASGNGHDLTEEGGGLPSIFHTVELGEKPVIQVGKASSFAVAEPFTLEDHSIFIVYRAGQPTQGLFSAARNDLLGIVLARDAREHLLHDGTRDTPYTGPDPGRLGTEYSITVLERGDGYLSARVNGRDVSGDRGDGTPLEVGRLFRVALSRAVTRDAEGLRLAELIFYGRRLTDPERAAVTAHLAEKYAIELVPLDEREAPPFDWSKATPQASLPATTERDLNVPGLAVTWTKPRRLEAPFRFDPAKPERLYCDRDAEVHLSVRLWLKTSAPDTQLRMLVLHNEDDYRMETDTVTRPDPDEPPGTRLVGRVDASLELKAGDWIEVVVARDGAEGKVTALPESVLLAVAE